ncbi:MAG: hypothetical protein ACOCXG_03080 [Nanoarchaeota archaeon]
MRKSQGEIFGVALFFVIIVIGIIVFSQIKALQPEDQLQDMQEKKMKVISESALNSILDISTGCEVERGKDSLRDLIQFCVDYTFVNSGNDPEIKCGSQEKPSCEYSKEILNNTMNSLFNETKLGYLPYRLTVFSDADSTIYQGFNITNYDEENDDEPFQYGEKEINAESGPDSLRYYGFKRAPPGVKTIPTSQRSVTFELYLYYR